MGTSKKHKKDKKQESLSVEDAALRKVKKEKKKARKKEKKAKKEKEGKSSSRPAPRYSSSPEIIADHLQHQTHASTSSHHHHHHGGGSSTSTRRERGERDRVKVSLNEPPSSSSGDRDRSGGGVGSGRHGGAGSSTGSAGGGDVSLSIEETNKLRAKLGLKPLQLDEGPKNKKAGASKDAASSGKPGAANAGNVVTVDGETFVHKKPESWTDRKRQDKIRERLAAMREKRQFAEKLASTAGLGTASEVDSAADWVIRSRQREEEKKRAAAREAMLSEMDAEFGVGEIVADAMVKGGPRYTASDLAGLTVEHSKEAFVEGRDTILVLKDRGVLEDPGDEGEVLINPTMETRELWEKNADIHKGGTGYNPYNDLAEGMENMDVDMTTGEPKKSLLSKYDTEIDGEEKRGLFKLDSGGGTDLKVERRELAMKEKLKLAAQSLKLPEMELAREYFTKEEMAAKFKKPKKVRKVRKLKALKADDLLDSLVDPEGEEGSRDVRPRQSEGGGGLTVSVKNLADKSSQDAGSASAGRTVVKSSSSKNSTSSAAKKPDIDLNALLKSIDKPSNPIDNGGDAADAEDADSDFDADVYAQPMDPEEGDDELEAALARSRRMNAVKAAANPPAPDLSVNLDALEPDDDFGVKNLPNFNAPQKGGAGRGNEDDNVVLDSISEYCRGVGDIPTFGTSGNRTRAEVPERDPNQQDESSSSSSSEEDSDIENNDEEENPGNLPGPSSSGFGEKNGGEKQPSGGPPLETRDRVG